ncbi:conserved hypothetical protein [Leishmania infantum JPCM5]|uniref:Alpha/beta_hydrolase_family/X-Pro_dipeptidyl-peptidase_(S15_family)_-_putative n=2 Tax=Leishmania infantum TaxID=5671 RepID=A0A6L0XKS8_LEIIN|nr:conserved hypothetical protein [Leishmania infantum JPCM5]CAC9511881.1 Alpha/beta_hydrolase_family/X-Pro_dipeptidyl-peptidase_(S15_family)_-_putative [Leishmania infantum]CAM69935.1 conserved hypothetical protein [Leishmania infantum JPCM5]SUZ43853.1 Alpha/beta_hydrolase_family/X-Pro_dipeptidyl-peptidase_(S15_family)_-_putative [Leishmania infantum]|eukprot:XP_001466886.1 conserved hypothetical protein [Leishmania infantum JPCM5]
MISARDAILQLTSGPSLMDSMCNFIIRPPRSTYEVDDLGPNVFRIGDDGTERFVRHDFELENMRGLRFQCSWFKTYPARRVPCVVYCHANCGGRYDGLEALFLLREGFSLFCFDFCGSGMSEGEYISLGFYERQDLVAVVEFLTLKSDEVDGVALWGRSMGAVAAIMYASKDPWIRCIVCDSPFASLRLLIDDLVERHGGRTARVLPKILVHGIVERIRKRIMKRAAFDIDDLDAVKYAKACGVPALLFHGADDDFVSPTHCEMIRDAFPIPCLQQFTPGGHNCERQEDIHVLIRAFLRLYLIDKPQGAREIQAARELQLANTASPAAVAAAAANKGAISRPSAPAAPAPKQLVPPASYGMRCAGTALISSSSTSATASSSTTSPSTSASSSTSFDSSLPLPAALSVPLSPENRLVYDCSNSRDSTPPPKAAATLASSLPPSLTPFRSSSGTRAHVSASTATVAGEGHATSGATVPPPSSPAADSTDGLQNCTASP